MGPATGALMRIADVVVIVIDDTILGLTAVDLYVSYVKSVVGDSDRIVFLVNPYSGSLLGIPQIAAELEPAHQLGELPWRLPPIPNDPKAAMWPGTGRTLYSLGQRSTRLALEHVAKEIGLVDFDHGTKPSDGKQGSSGGIFQKLFGSGKKSQGLEQGGLRKVSGEGR